MFDNEKENAPVGYPVIRVVVSLQRPPRVSRPLPDQKPQSSKSNKPLPRL